MSGLDGLMLMSILGQDIRFWITIAVASLLKWFFTPTKQTAKQAIAGIIAGAVAAFYGHEWVIRTFSYLTPEDKDIVVIGLVITGEHLVRTLMFYLPNYVNKGLGLPLSDPATAPKGE
jgi:hypothetical protein